MLHCRTVPTPSLNSTVHAPGSQCSKWKMVNQSANSRQAISFHKSGSKSTQGGNQGELSKPCSELTLREFCLQKGSYQVPKVLVMGTARLASPLDSTVRVIERNNLKEKPWAIFKKSYRYTDKKLLCIEKKLL